MKYALTAIISVMASIPAMSFLSALHSTIYDEVFNECKAELIRQKNYQSNEQAFECVEKDSRIKVLGTILFREGSVL